MAAILAGCISFDSDEVIALKPFPKLAEPRAVTGGPHDHLLADNKVKDIGSFHEGTRQVYVMDVK